MCVNDAFVCACVCVRACVSLPPILSPALFPSVSFSLCVWVCLCTSMSISLFLFLSLSRFLSVSFTHSLAVALVLALTFSRVLMLSPDFIRSLYRSLALSHSCAYAKEVTAYRRGQCMQKKSLCAEEVTVCICGVHAQEDIYMPHLYLKIYVCIYI